MTDPRHPSNYDPDREEVDNLTADETGGSDDGTPGPAGDLNKLYQVIDIANGVLMIHEFTTKQLLSVKTICDAIIRIHGGHMTAQHIDGIWYGVRTSALIESMEYKRMTGDAMGGPSGYPNPLEVLVAGELAQRFMDGKIPPPPMDHGDHLDPLGGHGE